MPQSSSDDNHYPDWMRRLNRVCGEINGFLLTVAIGLAVFDLTFSVVFRGSAEITRAEQRIGLSTSPVSSTWQRAAQPRRDLLASNFASW